MRIANEINSSLVLRPNTIRKTAIVLTEENSLTHYGVKGMKWGVRRTPEELGHKTDKKVAKKGKNVIIRTTISGHMSSPKISEPNSIIDHLDPHGKVDKRTYYDSEGRKAKDIHTTNHGNPKRHPYGNHGEHTHDYEWDLEGNMKNIGSRMLTSDEKKENDDIL